MAKEKQIFICIHQKRVFLNPNFYLENSNIPFECISFKQDEIYWEIYLHSYNKEAQSAKANILNYDVHIKDFEKSAIEQKTIGHNIPIKSIEFKLEWDFLEPLLSFYNKKCLEGKIENIYIPFLGYRELAPRWNPLPSAYDSINYAPISEEFRTINRSIKLSVSTKKLVFGDRVVVINDYKIPSIPRRLDIKIPNNFVQESFNLVKDMIFKTLSLKEIDISIELTIKGDEITVNNAYSESVAGINQTLLIPIRFNNISRLSAEDYPSKPLWGSQDLCTELTKINPLLFGDSCLITNTLGESRFRNCKELQYLNTLTEADNILITLPKYFGFLFNIKTADKLLFVWERPNSNATYVWSFNYEATNVCNAKEIIESEITNITTNGRKGYTLSIDIENLQFKKIIHVENNFKRWQEQLDAFLK